MRFRFLFWMQPDFALDDPNRFAVDLLDHLQRRETAESRDVDEREEGGGGGG